jgi:hypothetical protein
VHAWQIRTDQSRPKNHGFSEPFYDHRGYKRKAADCWITLGISATVHLVFFLISYAARH